MKRFLLLLLLPFFLLTRGELKAHPHVFLDTRVTVVLDSEGVTGFWIEWEFDEMFSAMIIQDFDEDYDFSFSPAEIANIEKNAFSNLKNFHYFTYVSWKGGEYTGKKIRDFSASIRGDTLVYRFFVPCRIGIDDTGMVIKVWIYDDSYYCDVGFAEEEPAAFEGEKGYGIEAVIARDERITYYFGQVSPQVLRLSVRRNDG
ncbi:MAG: DUF1007 family protein [Spirochaetes bacterium]|nr:DUF1007 family protein [Spirochaetota bacterium]